MNGAFFAALWHEVRGSKVDVPLPLVRTVGAPIHAEYVNGLNVRVRVERVNYRGTGARAILRRRVVALEVALLARRTGRK
tara:strand:- start:177 stop:416 length:240 start_codon:yes stop_codon:yes gene_type:complete